MKKALLFFLTAVTLTACTPPATTDGGTTVPADSSLAAADSTPAPQPVDSTTAVADNGEGSDAGNTGTTPTPKVDNGTDPKTDAGNTGGGRVRDPNLANTKMFKVTGNILVAGSYCGGAAPSKEMEEEARRPKPFANQGFLIRSGKMNALGTAMATRTRTDANGTFNLELAPGSYCMVLEEKESAREAGFYTQKNMVVDKPCDQKWLNTCDISFTVADKNISGLRLTLNKKCLITSLSPCITWNGPLPPAAAPRGK